MQKALKKVAQLLDAEDFNADSFAKAVSQLKTLKTHNTVDDDINTFMAFQDYLIRERQNNLFINDEFIKRITSLQDSYIQFRLSGNGEY